uniref:Uncharacterized protein n=1 Tax=Ciona savignyi TaxID=51511 RepID=H2YJ26_CIOSA
MERMAEIFRNNKHLIEHRKYMFSETMPKFRKKKRRGRPRKSVEVKNEKVTQLEEMDTQLLFPKNLSKSCNMKKNKLKDEVVPLVRTTSPISKKRKKGTTNKDELDKEDQTNINIRLCRVSKSANSYAVVKKRIISDQDDTQSSVITTTVVSPKNNDDDKVGVQSPSTECQTTLEWSQVDNITVLDVKEEPKGHTESSESVNADRELCKPNDASNPVVVEKECVSVPQDCLSPLSCMRLGVPATTKSLSLFTPKKRECKQYDCLAVMMKPLTAKEPSAENQLKSAVVVKNLKQNKKK